jgi:hypothetical protein
MPKVAAMFNIRMGAPISEVGYTSATTGKGDQEVHKGHVVALEKKILCSVKDKSHRSYVTSD